MREEKGAWIHVGEEDPGLLTWCSLLNEACLS